MSNNRLPPQSLKKNTRFECLNNGNSSNLFQHNRSSGDSHYNRPYRSGTRSIDQFSFLTKREPKTKRVNLDDEISKGAFPSLVQLKKKKPIEPENTDYLDMANKTEPENSTTKKDDSSSRKTGWLYLTRKNNVTIKYTIDQYGNKILMNSPDQNIDSSDNDTTESSIDYENFQYDCAIASFSILQNIQRARDNEIQAFGAYSTHWGKGLLTDLVYLSD